MNQIARVRVAERRSEQLIEELLSAQGWDLRRPPAGDLLAQHEYKDYPSLKEALAKCSKSGTGPGVPEFVLVDRTSGEPLAVFEAKAHANDIDRAVEEVESYGRAFIDAGYSPIAIAVAGTRDVRFEVRVLKHQNREWKNITYEGQPITWMPNRDDLNMIRRPRVLELRPAIPQPEVLKSRAEEINGLLRESGLKDDFRPAAIGAIMLALWKSEGEIRRDRRFILPDINQACEKAFWDAKKPDLAKSLHVDEANDKLAIRALRICEILERLNITTLTAEHDYLGALYEEFFRYTGGNTIGQYFTPRHITSLMADLCDVDRDDVVLDPACGTGGFLIAAMERMQQASKLPRAQIIKVVQDQLIGLEDEPVTASLCVANMVLRGDGSTGVVRTDCFDDSKFPFNTATIVLMNPPFPHRKTDVPPERFIDRSMEGLRHRGLAAVIVPSSLLVKRAKATWRQEVLRHHTLRAVISLPNELFQPYASSTTAILILERGVPHSAETPTFFCRISNDGFQLKKGTRVPVRHSQLPDVVREFRQMGNVPGFCGPGFVDESGWAPGAYIGSRELTDEEVRREIATLIRNKTSVVIRFAPEFRRLLEAVDRGELVPEDYARGGKKRAPIATRGTIGNYFNIYYGLPRLHNKENLVPGNTLVISSSGTNNGVYGFFDFDEVIQPPFAAVPSSGSIGEASVQEFPCGVTDDCLILVPKPGTPFEALYIAAAEVRAEKWRFDYGRKMTPDRIQDFPLRLDPEWIAWVRQQWEKGKALEQAALATLSDDGGTMLDDDDPTRVEDGDAALRRFEESVSRLFQVPKKDVDKAELRRKKEKEARRADKQK